MTRHAIVDLDLTRLRTALRIPDDLTIELVATGRPDTVSLILEGDNLPEPEDTGALPHLELDDVADPVGRLETYVDAAGEHRWRLVSDNGQPIAGPQEGYVDESHAARMAQRVTGLSLEP